MVFVRYNACCLLVEYTITIYIYIYVYWMLYVLRAEGTPLLIYAPYIRNNVTRTHRIRILSYAINLRYSVKYYAQYNNNNNIKMYNIVL